MKILVVDDHPLFRDGLISLLAKQPDMQIVGKTGTVREAIALACELEPDVVLMDYSLSDGNGLDATRAILRQTPRPKIVFLTVDETDERLFAALRSGAKGYLVKNTPVDEMLAQLRGLEQGTPALSPAMFDRLLAEFARQGSEDRESGNPQAPCLTGRETEIVRMVAQGLCNEDIAGHLQVSPNTVKNHLHNLFEKLGLRNRREATRYARQHGLVDEGKT